jgi:NAD+ synthase
MSLQQRIIKELGVQPIINGPEEIRKSVNFLKDYLISNTFLHTLVLGISGGQDSTLTGKLSQIAIEEIRHETRSMHYSFTAVRLPCGEQLDEQDCLDAIAFIKPDHVLTVNIQDAVAASESSLRKSGILISDYIKGNEKARERMKVQYSIAGMNKGLVVGTDHAAEALTGFFTKYGDGGTDINPIFRLNKRQGKLLLKELGCPKHLYTKVPTADLEDKHPRVPDETVLGITYEDIDNYLEGKYIEVNSQNIIEGWYNKTKHKRHLPITIFDEL